MVLRQQLPSSYPSDQSADITQSLPGPSGITTSERVPEKDIKLIYDTVTINIQYKLHVENEILYFELLYNSKNIKYDFFLKIWFLFMSW